MSIPAGLLFGPIARPLPTAEQEHRIPLAFGSVTGGMLPGLDDLQQRRPR
jgi:hypothetical protein